MHILKVGIFKLIFIVFSLVWTLGLVILFYWNIRNEREQTLQLATYEARSFFEQIKITREWNANHGGVYVPVTPQAKPNPYLNDPDRDVVTTSGRILTKINPAYMTRQIAEIADKRNNIKFSITSLHPVRSANAADTWERVALTSFEQGIEEYCEFTTTPSGHKAFRYMAPLWMETVCLPCHNNYGYKTGDLGGGISVTIPATILSSYHRRKIFSLMYLYVFVWLIGLCAAAVGIYALRRNMEVMRKSKVSAMLLTEQEKERKRIGQELHDGIGQSLSAVKFKVESLIKGLEKKVAPEVTKSLGTLVPQLQQTIEEVRGIVMDLRPSTLDDLGIIATISWFCREIEQAYKNKHITLNITVLEKDVPASLKIVIFRVLQEAINNAVKYSGAETISVFFRRTVNALELRVEDAGIGFGPEKLLLNKNDSSGIGIAGMRERIELSGGTFQINASKGRGTVVKATWKLSTSGPVS